MKDKKKLLISNINNCKLPDDVLLFLNDLDELTDPYDANYMGRRMSKKLNKLLEKYS